MRGTPQEPSGRLGFEVLSLWFKNLRPGFEESQQKLRNPIRIRPWHFSPDLGVRSTFCEWGSGNSFESAKPSLNLSLAYLALVVGLNYKLKDNGFLGPWWVSNNNSRIRACWLLLGPWCVSITSSRIIASWAPGGCQLLIQGQWIPWVPGGPQLKDKGFLGPW